MSTHDPNDPAAPSPDPDSPLPPPARPSRWAGRSLPNYAPGSAVPMPGAGPAYASPSAAGGNRFPPASVNPQMLGRLGASDDRPELQFKPRARSPLLPMIVYVLGAILGAIADVAALGWSDQETQRIETDNGTFELTRSTLTGGTYLVWFVVAVIVGSLFVWWMSRIGANWGGFGAELPAVIVVVYLFTSWIAIYIPFIPIVVMLVLLVWPIRLLADGIVRGGSLPRWLALFGWLPALTIVGAPLTALFWLVIPLTVTITQHIGIHQDRRILRQWEAARGR